MRLAARLSTGTKSQLVSDLSRPNGTQGLIRKHDQPAFLVERIVGDRVLPIRPCNDHE